MDDEFFEKVADRLNQKGLEILEEIEKDFQEEKKEKERTKTAKPRGTVDKARAVTAKKSGGAPRKPDKKVAKRSVSIAAVQQKPLEVPEGLPRKYLLKSTFNTHDIMHSPVEKTLKMIDKILSGERLFTM